ncbi:hypothetical protein N9119_03325 [Roseivirga sp.]|nr:hypothetical protein [Roseivirga sp.]
MAQNYMMGAGMTPPPAPGSPQAMNFQSDPMQRSQFKGFMSGIQAKQPAQMMPPQQPMAPAMPPQMANVDIFAAPQGFAYGGMIPGYANGGALDAFGGAGDDVGYQGSGYGTFNSDTGGYDMPSSMQGEFNTRNAISAMEAAAARQRPTALDDASAYIAGLFGSGSAAGPNSGRDGDNLGNAPTAAGGITDALAGQIAQNAARQQATAQMAAAERAAMQPQIDAIAGSYTPGGDRQIMDLLNAQEITSQGGTVNVNPQTGQIIATDYPNAITADFTQSFNVPGTSDQGFPTVDVMAGDMAASAQGKSVMDAFQDQYNMAQGSRIMDDYADSYNKSAAGSGSGMSTPISMPDQIALARGMKEMDDYQDSYNAIGPFQMPTPTRRPDMSGRTSPSERTGYDDAGLNPVSIYDRNPNYEESVGRDIPNTVMPDGSVLLDTSGLPTVSTESIMDRASRKDDMSDARNLVTRGFGAGMDPMEQLRARNERDIFDVSGPPGIGQAIQGGLNSVARGVTGNVLEKLEQPGSTPVYDETGQIVGVTHGGLFGGTVYTGRPDYNPTGRGANLGTEGRDEIRFNNRGGFSVGAGTGSSREAGGLDKFGAAASDAGDSFLKMLGFGG